MCIWKNKNPVRGLCCKLFVAASAGYFRRKKKKAAVSFVGNPVFSAGLGWALGSSCI